MVTFIFITSISLLIFFLFKTSIKKTGEAQMILPKLNVSGDILYLSEEKGTLGVYKTSIMNGKNSKLWEINNIVDIKNFYWSNDGKKAVIEVLKSKNIDQQSIEDKAFQINLEDGSSIEIPLGIIAPDWGNGTVAYFKLSSKIEGGLEIVEASSKDFKDEKKITSTNGSDKLKWIDDSNILLYTNAQKEESFMPDRLFIKNLNVKSGELSNITSSGHSADASLSPDKKHFIYEEIDPKTSIPTLYLADLTTKKTRNLGINTLTNKTAWSSDGSALFAAAPDNFTSENNPDEKDNIWKVDAQTGKKKVVYKPDESNREINSFNITSLSTGNNKRTIHLISNSATIFTITLPIISF